MNIIFRIFRKIKIKARLFYINITNRGVILGKNISFRNNFEINCSKNGKIIIGDNVFFNNGCSITSHIFIKIGNDSIFGENVKIYDHNHKFNHYGKRIQDQGYSSKEVEIGENCWIGSNVVVLAGSKIGSNVVVGAGTIVNGNIKSNCIVTQERNYVIKSINYM